MDKKLERILKKAPDLYNGEFYHLRYSSIKEYIEDLEYQLYIFDEDEVVKDAKEGYELAKRSNVSKHTLDGAKREYEEIKEEYNQLKKHLEYIKKEVV